jgi:hypothetical protein
MSAIIRKNNVCPASDAAETSSSVSLARLSIIVSTRLTEKVIRFCRLIGIAIAKRVL